jgi:hypothetical protein
MRFFMAAMLWMRVTPEGIRSAGPEFDSLNYQCSCGVDRL